MIRYVQHVMSQRQTASRRADSDGDYEPSDGDGNDDDDDDDADDDDDEDDDDENTISVPFALYRMLLQQGRIRAPGS